jgi:uncharacterized protein YndB with AHSA1/START domain
MADDDSAAGERSYEMAVDVDASPEAVWRAISDPEELVRWFPLEARVTPGEGGTMWWGWEEPWSFDTEVAVWDPGRQLRLIERRTDGKARDRTIAMDFTLEGRGGRTTLRFVHSGFGAGADWDEEYDGISRGWSFELRCLRHYLQRHPGRPRHLAWVRRETGIGSAEAARRLLGPQGLLAAGTIEGCVEGDPYTMRTAEGELLDGTTFVHQPPRHFAGIVPSLDDGLIRYEIEGPYVVLMLSLWGDCAAEAIAFQERWTRRLAALV